MNDKPTKADELVHKLQAQAKSPQIQPIKEVKEVKGENTELMALKQDLFATLKAPSTVNAIKQIMPANMDANKLMSMMFNELSRKPELIYCDKVSLIGALKNCAELGLMPGSILGHAHIIPFDNKHADQPKAQLMIDYKGFVQLLYNTGKVAKITARSVDANDEFDYWYGLNEDLIHRPTKTPSGQRVYFYVIVFLKDGSKCFNVMSRQEVEFYRNLSKFPKNTFWDKFYDEMALKTVFKRLIKWLPTNTELSQAVQLDEEAEYSANPNQSTNFIDGDYNVI